MSVQNYSETPFAKFDRLEKGEGERCLRVGYLNEEKVSQLFRRNGWNVTCHNDKGDYGLGYDITIEKDGIIAHVEIKHQSGRVGNKVYPTFFCETHHAGGGQSGWTKPDSDCTHFVITNEYEGKVYIFNAKQLREKLMDSTVRETQYAGCQGKLIGWCDRTAGLTKVVSL